MKKTSVSILVVFLLLLGTIYFLSDNVQIESIASNKDQLDRGGSGNNLLDDVSHQDGMVAAEKTVKKVPLSKMEMVREFLLDIENGKAVSSEEIRKILRYYFSNKDMHISSTLKFTGLYHFLNKNYYQYSGVIIELFLNKQNSDLIRLPMLEIISEHLNDQESLSVVKSEFLDKNNNSLILGKTAKALSKYGVDVSKELVDRYPNASLEEKRYYAKSFSYLNYNGAVKLIEEDIDRDIDVNIKASLIKSYADFSKDNEVVVNKLSEMINIDIPNSDYSNIEKEILLIQAVMGLSKSKTNMAYDELFSILSNKKIGVRVRSTALDSFHAIPYFLDKEKVRNNLTKLSSDIGGSKASTEKEIEYLKPQIDDLILKLEKGQ
jgi:hypothetical protein